MEMQLAAVLATLALGGALVVLFFGKWWQPLADGDKRVKELDDAVEALLQLRADVLKQLDGAPEPEQPRAWLRRVQDAQDEVASIKARHDAGQLYVVRLLQYFLTTGPVAGLAEKQLKIVRAIQEQGAALLEAALATPQAPPPLLLQPEELELPPETGSGRAYLNEALRFLGDCDAALGVWGAGGVGKTTVLKRVRDVCGRVAPFFDHVLLLAASRDCTVAKLQKEVVAVLGLRDAPTEQAQAAGILSFLRDKNFLLLLDGVWERLDLERVGIPQPLGVVAGRVRKVVVASRSEAVCADMGCRKKIKMECMNEDDAWSLFEANAGEEAIRGDAQISTLARQVAAECNGMPLFLATVGRAMSNKRTAEEWSDALDKLKKPQLTSSAPGHDKSAHPLVKFCFDSLESDTVRECLLTCALWPEDHNISKDELVQCWIGLGLLPNYDDVDESLRFGHTVVSILESARLLEQGDNHRHNMCPSDTHVRLHDVVRDAALQLAPGKWLVRAGVGLREPPRDEALWRDTERVSLMHNAIEEAPAKAGGALSDAQPASLMLQCNRALPRRMLQAIQQFTRLTYLDLEDTGILDAFPMEICCLVNLEFLNLSRNRILSLPMELSNLSRLKYLHLRDNYYIQITVPPGLISRLSKLQVLDLFTASIVSVADDYVAPVIDDLDGSGARMPWLGIWMDNTRDAQRLARLAPGVRARSIHLRKLDGARTLELLSAQHAAELGGVQEGLRELVVYSSDIEEIVADAHAPRLEVVKFGFLARLRVMEWSHGAASNLREVAIGACHALTHMTWVQHLPCLESLNLSGCNGMTRLVGGAAEGGSEAEEVVTFPRLRLLALLGLPRLEDIRGGGGECAFPELRRLQTRGCSRLRRIPMRPVAGGQGRVRVEGDKHWWNGLQWASDDVKACFVPVLL
ncbi:probable disease resistance protein At1g61300 [Triticum dicoccoides]|uniref:probable disease resistance protein At1g61300 n=1 Tax=Triticum dicoccoides TaxID=85692 RepID=UPI000E7CFBF4|nr:probable disease resistance protein At1g61300 [Triticum dicoccoides]